MNGNPYGNEGVFKVITSFSDIVTIYSIRGRPVERKSFYGVQIFVSYGWLNISITWQRSFYS